MAPRTIAVLVVPLVLTGAAPAIAADPIKPLPGVTLSGKIKFPRAQPMKIETDETDSSKLKVFMGFYGRCKGGGIGEAWSADVLTRQTLHVREGRFDGNLRGTVRDLGDVEGRSGEFRWRLAGRFIERDVALAKVTGTAEVRVDGRVISRCRIIRPASVRLAIPSS